MPGIERNIQFVRRERWVFLCTAGLQSVLVGVSGGRGAGRNSELGEDVAHVASRRLLADEKLGRNRAIRPAGGDEAYDLNLARGQAARRLGRPAGQRLHSHRVGCGAQGREGSVSGIELHGSRIGVAQLSASEADQSSRLRGFVGSVELAPESDGGAEGVKGLSMLTRGELDRAFRVRGERAKIGSLEGCCRSREL